MRLIQAIVIMLAFAFMYWLYAYAVDLITTPIDCKNRMVLEGLNANL